MTESSIHQLLAASGAERLVRAALSDPAVATVGTDGNRVWVIGAAGPRRIDVMRRSLCEGGGLG